MVTPALELIVQDALQPFGVRAVKKKFQVEFSEARFPVVIHGDLLKRQDARLAWQMTLPDEGFEIS